jgi:hypothetical protein
VATGRITQHGGPRTGHPCSAECAVHNELRYNHKKQRTLPWSRSSDHSLLWAVFKVGQSLYLWFISGRYAVRISVEAHSIVIEICRCFPQPFTGICQHNIGTSLLPIFPTYHPKIWRCVVSAAVSVAKHVVRFIFLCEWFPSISLPTNTEGNTWQCVSLLCVPS